jgi:hypothetical protein
MVKGEISQWLHDEVAGITRHPVTSRAIPVTLDSSRMRHLKKG